MMSFRSLVLLLAHGVAAAQTASPMTPPPVFPQAAAFDPGAAAASARQNGAMVRIPGGAYTIGSPAQHPLANQAAMPEHKVELQPFRIDRTEVPGTAPWPTATPPPDTARSAFAAPPASPFF